MPKSGRDGLAPWRRIFAGSSIEQVAYEGGNMAREGDCVVVSLNHRLNILGYLDLSDFGRSMQTPAMRVGMISSWHCSGCGTILQRLAAIPAA